MHAFKLSKWTRNEVFLTWCTKNEKWFMKKVNDMPRLWLFHRLSKLVRAWAMAHDKCRLIKAASINEWKGFCDKFMKKNFTYLSHVNVYTFFLEPCAIRLISLASLKAISPFWKYNDYSRLTRPFTDQVVTWCTLDSCSTLKQLNFLIDQIMIMLKGKVGHKGPQ